MEHVRSRFTGIVGCNHGNEIENMWVLSVPIIVPRGHRQKHSCHVNQSRLKQHSQTVSRISSHDREALLPESGIRTV